jgi:hypothetical protein
MAPDQLATQAGELTRVAWSGPVELDGKLWPLQDSTGVLVPAGEHVLTPAAAKPSITVTDFNGDVRSGVVTGSRVEVSYQSHSRSIATLASPVSTVEIDGVPVTAASSSTRTEFVLLPAGAHVVTFIR